MTYPTYYLRSKDFSEDVGSNSDHNAINSELDALSLAIQQIIDNLKLIQRADNELANDSVGVDQLAGNITLTVVEGVSEAQAAQSAAEAAQAAAEAAQAAAETAETNAETAETNAEAAEDLAEKWASNPEDVVVADGKYSAYHWAQKATEIGDVSGKVDKVPSATLNNIWKVGTGGVLVDSGIASADVAALLSGGSTTATLAAYGDCDTSIANTEFVQTAVAGANNQAPPEKTLSNSQAFTSSGTFTVPAGVTTVYVSACGGGGGGGSGGVTISSIYHGGAGGKGGNSVPCYREKVTVAAGASITVTVGAGGSGGAAKTGKGYGSSGGNGGTTSFGALLTVAGGVGGLYGLGGNGWTDPVTQQEASYPDQVEQGDTFQTGYSRYSYFDLQQAATQQASGLSLELATRTKVLPYKRQQKGANGTSSSYSTPTAGGTGVTYGGGGGGGGGTDEGYDPSGAGGAGRGGYLKVEW